MKLANTRQAPMRQPGRLRPIRILLLSALACWQIEAQPLQTRNTAAGADAQQSPSEVEFESGFLSQGGRAIDVSRYERGNIVPPGLYSADLYVNNSWVGRREVRLAATAGMSHAQPCMDQALLEAVSADLQALPEPVRAQLAAAHACLPMAQVIAQATASFDFDNLRLDLGIPQASLRRSARGYVSPDQWSEGVPAGMLGYNLNAYQTRRQSGASSTQGYLGLNGGLNLQRWHFRHNGSLSWDTRGQRNYQNIASYVQRNLPDWSSQLVIGDTYTSGDLMDSTSLRGLRLYSDDRMLPDSQRGYAPVVRGVANSNARVTISQNGMKLYETTVAPGPFVINDLFPTGYGGDLQVSVAEADGSVRSFAVPFASVPLALREGQNRYSLTAGLVRHLPNTAPFFTQATWQYGLGNSLTGYGGATLAKGYLSPMVGAVLNTTWGAFGMDLTHASTRIPGEGSYAGQSLRASYAKHLVDSGTNISIATYRYSTNGFFGLNDAMRARDQAQLGRPSDSLYRPRNRASLYVGQQLGQQGGNLSLNASTIKYWNRQNADINYGLSYSNMFRSLGYSLSATRQRDAQGVSSTYLYVGLSIPLGNERASMLTTNFGRDSSGRAQAQASTSGLLGSDNNLSYGLNASHHRGGTADAQTSAGANANYRGTFADFSTSLNLGQGYQQFSASARGAVVAHPGGLTLSRPLSDTFGIVEAKDAEGARIANASGVQVDGRGYAIVPYLTPFKMNEVSIDPKGLSTDVELAATSQQVAPLAGAVPMVVFKTTYSRSAVIRTRLADGSPVPFGAMVSDSAGNDLGLVGQAGKLLVRGLQERGELQAQWETEAGPVSCSLSYALAERSRSARNQPLQSLDLPCTNLAGGGTGKPATVAAARSAKPQPASGLQAANTATAATATTAPVTGKERSFAGLLLSTTVRVLVPETAAADQKSPKASQVPVAKVQPREGSPRKLRIERRLAGPEGTLAQAPMPASGT